MRRLAAAVFVIVGALLLALMPGGAQGPVGRPDVQRVAGRDALAREALVKFRRQTDGPNLQDVARGVDAERINPVGRSGAYRVRARALDVATLVARLAARGDVEYAEPNYLVTTSVIPNDPNFSLLWGLEKIQAPDAWDRSVGSTSSVVAVVDTGIDYQHVDLAANMWTAPAPFTVTVGGAQVHCAAGTHGYNAILRTCDPMDDQGHGTHVAGTIGAVGDNQRGVVGVNWTTRLMGIKFLDAQGSGSVADAIDGIQFAVEAKQAFAASEGANVRILSNSWGGSGFSQALLDEINAANDEEMLFVAAAGNSSSNNDIFPAYPANFDAPNLVSVAATSSNDGLAWFSNYGAASVHLAAPGNIILSTMPNDFYGYSSGTSMATPHVSGAAALVLSVCDLDTAALRQMLLDTVTPLAALSSKTITGGQLNVNSAVHACTGPPSTPSNLTASAGDARVNLAWSAPPGATRHIIRRSTTQGGPYDVVTDAATGAAFADVNVVNHTTYYYVVAAANALGVSGDSNEASATPHAPGDLVISSFATPPPAGAGEPLSLTITTRNQGTGSVLPTTTAVYLSTDWVRDASDRRLSPDLDIPALGSGASFVSSTSVMIPADIATGTYHLFAVADAGNSENESVETNNQTSRSVRVGPDLVVSTLSVPASGAAGTGVTVSDTTRNSGGGPASASEVTFYLSSNTTVDASDTVLEPGHPVPALAPNATHTASVSLTIPASTATGTHYIIAKIDAGANVVETQETNNTRSASIRIGPDLRVSSVTRSPSTVAVGGTLSVTSTVSNVGAGAAGATVAAFYLSANYSWDAGDIHVGTQTVAALAGGQASTATTQTTIPAGTPAGTYYLLVQADSTGAVSEVLETNNVTASGSRVTISP